MPPSPHLPSPPPPIPAPREHFLLHHAQWWGCTVAGAVPGERDESGLPVFSLHYDAFQAFEEADHDVTFTDAFRLTHLEDGAEMTWKKEGQEVDKDAVMASLANEDVDLQEVSFRLFVCFFMLL